jgi:predicted secreted protein
VGWFSGLVVYVIIWWVLFFLSLPWGARSAHEAGEAVEEGMAESAPLRPRLWLKAAITSVLAAALWGVAYVIIGSDMWSFRAR